MLKSLSKFFKRHTHLIVAVSIFLILVLLFHEILKPFIVAVIVAYIINPLVKRMNKLQIRKHNIPRGVAVLVAYLLFLSAIVGIGFAFIPSLTNEVSQATEALPKYLTKVKDEDIPKWNATIDRLLNKLSFKDNNSNDKTIQIASKKLNAAFDVAVTDLDDLSLPTVDTTGKRPLLINGERPPSTKDIVAAATAVEDTQEPPVLFRFKKTSNNSYDILPGDSELVFTQNKDGGYTLRVNDEKSAPQNKSNFNLEREITKALSDFVESSTQYAGSALSVIQYAIEFIINTFIQFILVFMLAAFISVDSPKLMADFRKLFEDKNGEAKTYDEYKDRVLKGLSGVVQGQIIICCINGTLTGIGLYILGVDFSLLLGIIAGLFSIVPIFGTIISTIPAVLLGLVQGPLSALLVLVWILAVHFMDTNFFTPKIVGSSSNLHPVLIIFALLAGQYCAGVLGLILAVPVTSICVTSIKFMLEHTKSDEDMDVQMPAIQMPQMQSVVVPAISRPSMACIAIHPEDEMPINATELDEISDTTEIVSPEDDLPTSDAPEIVPEDKKID